MKYRVVIIGVADANVNVKLIKHMLDKLGVHIVKIEVSETLDKYIEESKKQRVLKILT